MNLRNHHCWACPQEATFTGGNSQTWAGWVSAHRWFPAPDGLSTPSLLLSSWWPASSSFLCSYFTSFSSNLPTVFFSYSQLAKYFTKTTCTLQEIFFIVKRDMAYLHAVSSSSQFLGRKSPLPSDTFGVWSTCPATLLCPLFLWCLPLSPFIVISLPAHALHYPSRLLYFPSLQHKKKDEKKENVSHFHSTLQLLLHSFYPFYSSNS